MWMPSLHPVFKHLQQHDTIRVPTLVVRALNPSNFYMVCESVRFEHRSGLRVDAADNDGLMHTFQGHAEKKQACDFYVAGEVHKYFT
jgi:hypothetical protein